MGQKPRFFDDLTGIAGGAFSLLEGVKEEIASIVQSQFDEILAKLNLVKHDEFDIANALIAKSRLSQENLEKRIDELETRIKTLESKL
ncbi:accessory factor UbiK family protein [Entomobacter blattae]|uniref:Membrane fusogenic protein n=1 Tax=Entomobacter blattae TaxID=2762277 RepID=A0A7H1NQ86_9PROT|nr:accessory factor UbiK family protein [Entomobacter blattae]QNT77946.1 Membrane fusogenic protein [Entomobacter blattae]